MTPTQADAILDAVVNSRATSRAMATADSFFQKEMTAADDAAFQKVLRLITEATQ